jgi:hypothetical protein
MACPVAADPLAGALGAGPAALRLAESAAVGIGAGLSAGGVVYGAAYLEGGHRIVDVRPLYTALPFVGLLCAMTTFRIASMIGRGVRRNPRPDGICPRGFGRSRRRPGAGPRARRPTRPSRATRRAAHAGGWLSVGSPAALHPAMPADITITSA